jgi:hypothetical protein
MAEPPEAQSRSCVANVHTAHVQIHHPCSLHFLDRRQNRFRKHESMRAPRLPLEQAACAHGVALQPAARPSLCLARPLFTPGHRPAMNQMPLGKAPQTKNAIRQGSAGA